MVEIQIKLNENLFLRDPQLTKLGRKIVEYSIILIDELGFERFTFKKLAEKIDSTEASVYRYFENKHKMLLFLVSWYWEWIKFQIEYHTMNIESAAQKLQITLSMLVESSKTNPAVEHVDEKILQRIIVSEAVKAYHSKDVDEENKAGLFSTYKSLCKLIAEKISAVNEDFPYPKALANTLLELANNNIYYADHLPTLTEVRIIENDFTELKNMLETFAFGLLGIARP